MASEFGRRAPLVASALLAAVVFAAGCGTSAPAATSATPGGAAGGQAVAEITFVGPSESWTSTQFEADRLIAQDWKQLGLKVNLVTTPDWVTFTGYLAHNSWQAAAAAYLGTQERVDPEELLSMPLLCNLPTNYGHYCDPAYDSVVDQANTTLDQTQRRKLVFQAQQLLARDLPLVVEFYPDDEGLYNKQKVSHVVSALGAGLFNFWDFIEAQPVGGTTLQVGTNSIGTINPLDVGSYNTDINLMHLVYDTLARVDPTGQVVPWAARSWRSQGSETIDVTLRSGLKFTDGVPLTANDVKWSYDEFTKVKTPYYLSDLNPIASIDVTGPTTLVFHLKRPDASFFSLTLANVPILPEHIWAKVADPTQWSQPNMTGSGPYKLVSFQANGQTVLERNPDAIQVPKARKLVFTVYDNGQSFFAALQQGSSDFCLQSLIIPSMVAQAKSLPQLAVVQKPSISVRWLTYDMGPGSPFANYAFRDALSQAIDYPTIVSAILQNTGTAGEGIIAPANLAWHDPAVKFPSFNLAAARQTLKAAGYTWNAQGALLYPAHYKPQVLPQ